MKPENIIAKRPNKVIFRDGNRCIKLFDAEFSKADILNEALNQARVEETGLNIPKIHEVVKIDGQWKHMDSTPGRWHEMYSIMNDETRYETLTGRDWDRTAWPAVE